MAEDTLDLDAIANRSASVREFVEADPCNETITGRKFLPLSVREHFGHDVPALLAEVRRLRQRSGHDDASLFEAARVRDELADKVLTLQAELGEAQYQRDVARSVRDMARNALTATEHHVRRMDERWEAERRRAEGLAEQLHGRWLSAADAPWQNACWCVETDEEGPFFEDVEDGESVSEWLKRELRRLAADYRQDSIKWDGQATETEYLTPSGQ